MLLFRTPLSRCAFVALLVLGCHEAAFCADDASSADRSRRPASDARDETSFTCRVVEKGTETGIADARVRIRFSMRNQGFTKYVNEFNLTTDGGGRCQFAIPPELVDMTTVFVHVHAEHASYVPGRNFAMPLSKFRRDILDGVRLPIEKMELHPGQAVYGTVVDPNGQAARGVNVHAYSEFVAPDRRSTSLSKAVTDAEGRFKLMLHSDVPAVVSIIPRSYAVIERYLGKQRGELGEFRLSGGIRVTGKLVDVDHRPVANVPVRIDFAGRRDVGGLSAGNLAWRAALSDNHGEFSFAPLLPGDYRVSISPFLADPLTEPQSRYETKVVVPSRMISLNLTNPSPSVELQAVPYVEFHLRFLDSALNTVKSDSPISVAGQFDNQFWNGMAYPSDDGSFSIKLPHGLTRANFRPAGNDEYSYRYRIGTDQPWNGRFQHISLGTLHDDIDNCEIIRYQAPVVQITAVNGETNEPISKLKITAKYQMPLPNEYIRFSNGGEIGFNTVDDLKYRSSQMLPDEEATLTISTEGFATVEEKVKLNEGEVREVIVKLSKVP